MRVVAVVEVDSPPPPAGADAAGIVVPVDVGAVEVVPGGAVDVGMEALAGVDAPGLVVPPAAGDEVECGPAVEAVAVVREVSVPFPAPVGHVPDVPPNPVPSTAGAASRPTTMAGSRSAAASPPVS